MSKKIIQKIKNKPIYAFIDSQNLNLGTSKNIYRNRQLIYKGWKLDFKKFHRFLSDKFRVTKAFLFIGYLKQYEGLYKSLCSFGYQLVFKPTVKDNHNKPKGNVDAELVLHSAAIEFKNYQKAVIVSGDGDFFCLHQYLIKNKKLLKIIIPNKHSESSLLKNLQLYKLFLYREKEKLEYLESPKIRPKKIGRRHS
ncbi:NYN domain-containing protein [Patescibacteria group bacterium]|nr:NYN domain-containing protein [Patescibacteria group bacterium]MCG2702528.1 NYN domain-containing protein [Candidatus Parcubacteria bacterium]MBU4265120.1 NYN domain-containing protein [Patescibacteria group bacterium]MBU4390684.1 NYN domain-containing protein [Patescibacteria group bacterium]MBU4397491.1 NYN domain-containing protein [Patescibacteria group bacterium]